ncbi:TIGR02647 family protein [Vibrio palustris]|uniref:Phosphate-starvation-inducible E n=1 Tax=Vibrio palustris TaxID=1918946 RepID=A0A1R4B2X3_9VIBR|nr:TIGR02647 family protein [Vibrio palustris]SJL83259.1 Phosphate-starvation-inducible E [Vibrio palustris]
MKFSLEQLDELNLLLHFNLDSAAVGIKVHSDAPNTHQYAIDRLYKKGLCTLPDGGYLTHEGIEAAEQAQRLYRIMN